MGRYTSLEVDLIELENWSTNEDGSNYDAAATATATTTTTTTAKTTTTDKYGIKVQART